MVGHGPGFLMGGCEDLFLRAMITVNMVGELRYCSLCH